MSGDLSQVAGSFSPAALAAVTCHASITFIFNMRHMLFLFSSAASPSIFYRSAVKTLRNRHKSARLDNAAQGTGGGQGERKYPKARQSLW